MLAPAPPMRPPCLLGLPSRQGHYLPAKERLQLIAQAHVAFGGGLGAAMVALHTGWVAGVVADGWQPHARPTVAPSGKGTAVTR